MNKNMRNANQVILAGDVYEGKYEIKFNEHLDVVLTFTLHLTPSNAGLIKCEWKGDEVFARRHEFEQARYKPNTTYVVYGELWGSNQDRIHIKIQKLEILVDVLKEK